MDQQHHAGRRFAVPAGATDLLTVILQRFRESGMNDDTYVGLVDAHSKTGIDILVNFGIMQDS